MTELETARRELHQARELLALARVALRHATDPHGIVKTALVALETQGHALTLLEPQIAAGARVICQCRKPIGRAAAIDAWHAMN